MKHDFWHSRWEEGRIGFHRQDFHPSLSRFWDSLKVARPGRVFVPLCGKSRDMMWLAGQGYAVLGSELSERACRSYFAEAELACSEDRQGAFIHFQSAETDILCGDFFALSADQLAGVAAVYDRAALIALPAMMRQQYADVLCALCSVLCALCSVLCALCSVLCA
ncbi:class I SAM-dependent methyltransferase, partial [Marinobacterium jannaschii]|uniref:hypothetical protein n=1 Tax=Marinobacterium jannaschii TaxID=64970 RepID=UPI001B80BCA8